MTIDSRHGSRAKAWVKLGRRKLEATHWIIHPLDWSIAIWARLPEKAITFPDGTIEVTVGRGRQKVARGMAYLDVTVFAESGRVEMYVRLTGPMELFGLTGT